MEKTQGRRLVILEKDSSGKRNYRDFERGTFSREGKKEPYSPSLDSVSESEAELSSTVDEVLDGYRKWLKDNDLGGLTIVQAGAHLLLQIDKSGTKLGAYMRRMLDEPTLAEGKDRQRGVLPLPILNDSRKEVGVILSSGDYRRLAGTWKTKQQMKGGKVAREMRRIGLLTWHFLLCCGLNFQWTGGKSVGGVCLRDPTKAQKKCLDHLWESAKLFVDDRSEVKEKLLKAPSLSDWSSKLDGVRISYQGETVEKAREVTLDQIMPGLPPEGYGGRIQLADLCDGEVKDLLLHPEKCMLQGEELPVMLPRPRVMASDEEWDRICGALYKRGLIKPVTHVAMLEGAAIENGAFGVPKPGKFLDDGREVLRLIMDFRPANAVTRVIEGDVRTLAGSPTFQHIVLPEGQVLRMSAEDLVSAFYLFGLPDSWTHLMSFQKLVSWKALGIEKEGRTRVGACVLPMGWASAVGVLQHAHRRLALASPLSGGAGLPREMEIRKDAVFPKLDVEEGAAWSLYIDDTTLLEMMEASVAKEVQGRPSEEQERLRAAYTHWGIPFSKEKSLKRSEVAEKLGAVLDGNLGQLRAASRRALENLSLGTWILQKEMVSKKALQVWAGKEVHTLQFRRPLFSVLDEVWKKISEDGLHCRVNRKLVQEMLLLSCLQGLKYTDLRAQLSEVVTASDACESGGGIVFANRLSRKGLLEAIALEEGWDEIPRENMEFDNEQVILVIDFFAGIGGLSRALELARVPVAKLVIVEADADCRRLHRRRWPGVVERGDIKRVTKDDVRGWMKSVTGLTGVIAGGGSPCQGLSLLSSERRHFDDPRSALFFNLAEALGWVQDLACELQVWSVRFCENVVGDDQDVEKMSEALRMECLRVCSGDLSWVRRPRLYWSSAEMDDHPSFERQHGEVYDVLKFRGETEPLELVCSPGWSLPGAELDGSLRLPTFTRAIPRKKAPPQPAGIQQCDDQTLRRWKADHMKFPPYTYQPQYLFRHLEDERVRVANAQERELLMGYKASYTKALFKKDAKSEEEEQLYEDRRMAALGNAFHAPTVAVLIDLWLWSKKVRTDPVGIRAILQDWHEEMGKMAEEIIAAEKKGSVQGLPEDLVSESEELNLVAERRMFKPQWIRPPEDFMEASQVKSFSQRLVHHYLRRMEFRGSDVRLDLGIVFRPDAAPRTSIDPSRWVWTVAHSWPYRQEEHINVLELRAILHTLEWRARGADFNKVRFLHLADSQICLAVLTKGRSSSRKLNRLLQKICSLCLALNVYPLWAWVESRLNPADGPSRRFEDGKSN